MGNETLDGPPGPEDSSYGYLVMFRAPDVERQPLPEDGQPVESCIVVEVSEVRT